MKCPEPDNCTSIDVWSFKDRNTDEIKWTWTCSVVEAPGTHETRGDALQEVMEAHS